MKQRRSLGGAIVAGGIMLVAVVGGVAAQQPAKYEPRSGQAGKDVVWVPTPQALVDKMLDTAKLTAADILYDLGSGDGRTVITAAKRGATAFGIEYNPDMVELSKQNAIKEGVAGKTTFMKADLFETDFSKANVLTLFLLPDLNLRLRPKILDMKPGTRVVSNSFDMGDWEPDLRFDAGDACASWCRGHYWIVPAKVEGTWKAGDSEIVLKQTYQMVSGQVKRGNVIAPITAGRLTGDQITFTAGGTTYTGKVSGNRIEGTAGSAKLEATKG
jgi:SAM-dependent methyltransferase